MNSLNVLKTYKLFINGLFPRTESGRSTLFKSAGAPVAHLCKASRKDLREAVEAARTAQPKWALATAYNRGQVLYRMAEMVEGRRAEFVESLALAAGPKPRTAKSRAMKAKRGVGPAEEVSEAIDRLVWYAGWADKFAQVLGCRNPVAGPYYNFSTPEPMGVVAVVAPDAPALLGLVNLLGAVIVSGNAAVALASEHNPIPACLLGEVCATSDVPAGVVNILTGERAELIDHISSHREITGVAAVEVSATEATTLRLGAAENLKRINIFDWDAVAWMDAEASGSPNVIERFTEIKTIWHPSAV